MFDLLLHGGTLIDGSRTGNAETGGPPEIRDVALTGGRIATIGDLAGAPAHHTLDCRGLVIAPGLIDVHNHSDGWMLTTPHQTWKTTQGFTTEILMADGISYAPVSEQNWRSWLYYLRSLNGLKLADYTGWRSLADYLDQIDGRNVQNAAFHVPYANVRALATGFGRTLPPDDFQMRQIQAEIRRGMELGAVGLSTGLDYIEQCHATTDELVAACEAIRPYDGLYVTHVRYKIGLLPALREAIEIGRRAGVKVHISHLKGSSPQEVDEVLALIDSARRNVDLSFEVYPYQRGSTMLNFLLPYEVWQDGPLGVLRHLQRPEIRARFRAGLDALTVPLDEITLAWTVGDVAKPYYGQTLSEFVSQTDQPLEDVLVNLLIDSNLGTLMVLGPFGQDHLVEPLAQHDLAILGSDGIYFPGGATHPRVFGSAGRWLGPWVRDRKVFSLVEAVHKATGKSAERFGLAGSPANCSPTDCGFVRPGARADLLVFDPATVTDHATYSEPQTNCTGIHHVLVGGVPVVADSSPLDLTGDLPGRILRRHS
ncbi:MAG: D-aminoacylase [Pirellulaceae bacterium]|nr:D-aminoacylase [Pirellulaceae bacterium]